MQVKFDWQPLEKTVIAGATSTTTYSYNAANEIVNVNGTQQYTHDFNGNMNSAYGYTYTYNAENQLIRIDLSGAEVARYEYDSKGLRTRKITPARTERFYYDGDQLAYVIEENTGASQNKLKYFFTRDTQGRLMHMVDYTAATPKTYCYILDVHGNVVALVDENGNRVVNYEYDAWGNITNTPESVTTGNGEYLRNANPFRYSSYQFDPESGLYYLKARYYTATIGRFLIRDKVHWISQFTKRGQNLYNYCWNNPVIFLDPTGNKPPDNEIPPKSSGYKPPKGGARKGVAKNGKRGWVDKDGNVWAPDPSNTKEDHWDVQYPNGGYDNVYRDGRVRKGKGGRGTFSPKASRSNLASNVGKAAVGAAIVWGAWEVAKWGTAIALAPPTGGGSLVGAALLP